MYACMYVCMYVRMYVCINTCSMYMYMGVCRKGACRVLLASKTRHVLKKQAQKLVLARTYEVNAAFSAGGHVGLQRLFSCS